MPLGSLNPTPDPRAKRLRQLGLFGLAMAAALGAGWWWGQRQPSTAAANAKQTSLERNSEQLETKLAAGTASDEEQRQLLRLRLAMGDQPGAIKLLEPLSDQNPEQPSLRLLLADLKSQNDDNAGAEREIRQVLNVQPLHPQALQDYARLQLKLGRQQEVMQQLQASAEAAKGTPEALPIGLLLADVQQSNGLNGEATATYQGLIASHPADPRPMLALALLRHSQGDLGAARSLLQQAKLNSTPVAAGVLDQVAAGWAVGRIRAEAPSANAADLKAPVAPDPTAGSEPGGNGLAGGSGA